MTNTSGPDAKPEIVIVGHQRAELVAALEEKFTLHHAYKGDDLDEKLGEIGPRIRGAVGHGMAGMTKPYIERLPNLEVFAIHGVGLETTDLPACAEAGITVTTTPVLFDDVADLAIGLALACCRRIAEGDRYVRAGKWQQGRMPSGRKLSGMKAGIIGLGRIGRTVARRLEGFDCDICYTDPAPLDVPYRAFPNAQALAEEVDVLFLCAAGAAKGTAPPMIDGAMLQALGPQGIFVNIARGWLVDEPALVAALKDGQLGAAGLDVFDDEPNVPEALIGMENVVLTPHVASATLETQQAMGDCVIENLVSWFAGKGAVTPVPPPR